MSSKDSLGDRMKGYEKTSRTSLMRRTPVIIRLDGKAFHTYTKQRQIAETGAFSQLLYSVFREATYHVITQMQGARLAYMQSDEVSILLTDWRNLGTNAWFANGVQKMTSVAASMMTYYFNREAMYAGLAMEDVPAFFDARAFNVPFYEVTNYFIWRQQDATRNSVQMLGQSKFSHKALQGKSSPNIQDMLVDKFGINWNDTQTNFKRGQCITSEFADDKITFEIDESIPIFTQDREFIERHLKF